MAARSQSLLWRYLEPVKAQLFGLLALLLTTIGLQVYTPQLMRQFLDQAEAGVLLAVLGQTAVLFFSLTLLQKGLYLISVYTSEDLGWRATNQLRLDLTHHILRLDMGFHKLKPAGELIERIDGDISNLAEYFSELVINVFSNGLLVSLILLLLFWEDWRVGVLGLVYGALLLSILKLIQNRAVAYWTAVREAVAALHGFLEERFGGLEDIRANGGEAYVMARLYGLMSRTFKANVRASVFTQISFTAGYFLYALALTGAIAIGIVAYRAGEMSVGTIVLLITYMGLLEKPFNAIRRELETLQRALASIGRVDALFKIVPQVQERVTAVLPEAAPAVVFSGVRFEYEDLLTVNDQRLAVNG